MRNRNLINQRLERLEHTLINLERIVNTQEPIEVYKATIQKALDTVDEIKGAVESEPMNPSEMNRI
jgi:hypothetical protein